MSCVCIYYIGSWVCICYLGSRFENRYAIESISIMQNNLTKSVSIYIRVFQLYSILLNTCILCMYRLLRQLVRESLCNRKYFAHSFISFRIFFFLNCNCK